MNKGFSLVEMLFYVVVLTSTLLIVLNTVTSIVSSSRSIGIARAIDNSAISALERITREVRGADNIVVVSSVLGVDPGDLVLSGVDELDNPRTVRFYISQDELRFVENGQDLGSLTQSNTRVTNLVFNRFASSDIEGVRVTLTIESGTSTNYKTETFYSSATIR